MSYTVAWIVAGIAGLIGTFGLYMLARRFENGSLKNLLCLLPLVLMLVPAPVPGFAGHFAPAFVVAIFESAFVADGRPRVALVILAVALLGAALAILLVSRALAGTPQIGERVTDTSDN